MLFLLPIPFGFMSKKQIAEDFLGKCASGNSHEAFKLYASPDFKFNNAYFKSGTETLTVITIENTMPNPVRSLKPLYVVEEENFIAVHSQVKLQNDGPAYTVMHMLRFEGNKIAEVWGFGKQLTADS
ncbi:MAG TPA: nuclear transport factor 2 family protein [Flavobacteriales bacterium]|nr:nuclear transport factor 2 family protein [Flavobacteriales bacterium]